MGARSRLRMRAQIDRDVATGTDPYGNPLLPQWQTAGAQVPCRVWHDTSKQERREDGEGTTIASYPIFAMFARGADVQKEDRIVTVEDEYGDTAFEGLVIDSVLSRPRHIQVICRSYQ